jgi:hypothetical protein
MANLIAACLPQGNADMYGLGIRLGFYLQWSASILANLLMLESKIMSTRFALNSFTAAVFIALSVQTASRGLSDLDRYVTLLLCFGPSYANIPIFFWRLLTCFKKNLDPTRWSAAPSSVSTRFFSGLILIGIAILQFIFWGAIRHDSEELCPAYAFLFARVSLYSTALRVVHLVLSCFLVLIAFVGWVGWLMRGLVTGEWEYQGQNCVNVTPETKKAYTMSFSC